MQTPIMQTVNPSMNVGMSENPHDFKKVDSESFSAYKSPIDALFNSKIESNTELLNAWENLSEFVSKSAWNSKLLLRSEVEKLVVSSNNDFLSRLKPFKEELDSTISLVASLSASYNDMLSKIKVNNSKFSNFLEDADKLIEQSDELEVKRQVIDSFMRNYQLSPSESEALESANENHLPIEFFTILKKIHFIHEECKRLLKDKQFTIGIEVMEQMSALNERAYQKLCQWTQNHCHLFGETSPDINVVLRDSFSVLLYKPILYKYAVDEFIACRQRLLSHSLVDVLTRGEGSRHPIEIRSHDPVRYCSDLLNWVYKACCEEKNVVDYLIPLSQAQVLDTIICSISEPLKVRFEQAAILNSNDTRSLLTLSEILSARHEMLKILLEDSPFCLVIDELRKCVCDALIRSINIHTLRLNQEDDRILPQNLSPHPNFLRVLSLISEVRLSSIVADIPFFTERIMQPLVQSCLIGASRLPSVETSIFTINCLLAIKSTSLPFSERFIQNIDSQISAQCDILVQEQVSATLQRTGLIDLCSSIKNEKEGKQMISLRDEIDSLVFKSSTSKLEECLKNSDDLMLPQYGSLNDSAIRDTVKARSVDVLSKTLEQLLALKAPISVNK